MYNIYTITGLILLYLVLAMLMEDLYALHKNPARRKIYTDYGATPVSKKEAIYILLIMVFPFVELRGFIILQPDLAYNSFISLITMVMMAMILILIFVFFVWAESDDNSGANPAISDYGVRFILTIIIILISAMVIPYTIYSLIFFI